MRWAIRQPQINEALNIIIQPMPRKLPFGQTLLQSLALFGRLIPPMPRPIFRSHLGRLFTVFRFTHPAQIDDLGHDDTIR